MAKKVIDELGREFKSLYAAAHAWGLYGIGGSNVEKLAAHTGFLDLQFDVIDGGICNLAVKLFPFYA